MKNKTPTLNKSFYFFFFFQRFERKTYSYENRVNSINALIPKNYKEILNLVNADKWERSINKEL